MEAMKQIPQSFFEVFARLVPGILAFSLWLGLFDGGELWQQTLKAFTAQLLSEGNVTFVSFGVALVISYVIGQLAAPFGKAMQRITEALARKKTPSAGEYDWLRANKPELGALAAKIRAEHTMFYSLSSILFIAWLARVVSERAILEPTSAILLVLSIACAARGHAVSVTFRETSRKLKDAIDYEKEESLP